MPAKRVRGRKRVARGPARIQVPLAEAPQVEVKPPRGVKLKTVSNFTLIFALICFAALLAGRPPASASDSPSGAGRQEVPIQSQSGGTSQGMMIRNGSLVSSAGSGNRSRKKPKNARDLGRPLDSCLAMRSKNTSS